MRTLKSPDQYKKRQCAKAVNPPLPSIDYGKFGSVTKIYGATPRDIKLLCQQIANSDKVYFTTEEEELMEDNAEVMETDDEDDEEEDPIFMPTEETDVLPPNQPNAEMLPPKKSLNDNFSKNVAHASRNYASMHPELCAAVKLMKMLDNSGCSVALYDKIMAWHMQNLQTKEAITSRALHDRLVSRYNLADTLPIERKITLPYSKLEMKIPCHDAKSMVMCMLTDPRIKDEDYLFFNNNPLEGIPPGFNKLADINSGLCYRETYKQLIEPQPYTQCGRRRILMPFIFYFDGSAIGAYSNLLLQVLKMTVGVFARDYRNKDYAWRPLCYMPSIIKGKGKAKKMVEESNHVDSSDCS